MDTSKVYSLLRRARNNQLTACITATLAISAIPATAAQAAVNFSDPTNTDGLLNKPLAAASADFNADGKADIATTRGDSKSVSILLAKDDAMTKKRSFTAGETKAVANLPVDLVVGDFNNDNYPDIAAAAIDIATSNGFVVVFINKADNTGTFYTGAAYASLKNIQGITSGKLNADGFDDIAVTGGTDLAMADNTVQTFVGTAISGNPLSLKKAARPGGTARPSIGKDATIGDFNGDQKPDVGIADVLANQVLIVPGSGDGSFDESKTSFTTVGTSPTALVSTSIDQDSNRDLVVANARSNDISILHGNGSGGFAAQEKANVTYTPDGTGFPVALALKDLDGNGTTDIASALLNSHRIAVVTTKPDGTVNKVNHYGGPDKGLNGPVAVMTDDFTNSKRVDIAAVNKENGRLSVFTNISTADPDVNNVPPGGSGNPGSGNNGNNSNGGNTNVGPPRASALQLKFTKSQWRTAFTKRRKTVKVSFTASKVAKVQIQVLKSVKTKAKRGKKAKTKLIAVRKTLFTTKVGLNTVALKLKGLKKGRTYTLKIVETNAKPPGSATAKLKIKK